MVVELKIKSENFNTSLLVGFTPALVIYKKTPIEGEEIYDVPQVSSAPTNANGQH